MAIEKNNSGSVKASIPIEGIRIGHFTDPRRPTGCTVVLAEKGAVAGVDVRGSAPGTRETDLLSPVNTVEKVHAIVLSGGSAFGLASASGVVRYLEERGIGYPTGSVRVPIVPAAILYDLSLGDSSIRPDADSGYRACLDAKHTEWTEGNVGAGAGATVGKLLGFQYAMKGGLGVAAFQVGRLRVGAIAAVNAAGDIADPRNGRILAGAWDRQEGRFLNISEKLHQSLLEVAREKAVNTTLAVVMTNAALSKAESTKVAQMVHDGFARVIRPVHMPSDGDTAFALSTGQVTGISVGQIGALAADAVAEAILRGIKAAVGIAPIPSYREVVEKSRL